MPLGSLIAPEMLTAEVRQVMLVVMLHPPQRLDVASSAVADSEAAVFVDGVVAAFVVVAVAQSGQKDQSLGVAEVACEEDRDVRLTCPL